MAAALGARRPSIVGRVPDDFRLPLHQQEVTAVKIREQQCRTRFEQQVAEGIEVAVARIVGNGQRVAIDAHKARSAAAMRDVAALCVDKYGIDRRRCLVLQHNMLIFIFAGSTNCTVT